MDFKRILLLCAGLWIITAVSGCSPMMVGTDMGVYYNTKLYSVSDKNMDTVYEATLRAMDKLQLHVTDKAKDVFAAKVEAKSADDKNIIVKMKPLDDNKTQYTIQVGTFGEKQRSQTIFNEIKNNLAKM
jgi:hypothetical protein